MSRINLRNLIETSESRTVDSIIIYGIRYVPEFLTVYIGQTKNALDVRFLEHYKNGSEEIKKAFRQYGEDNFEIYPIKSVTKDKANLEEALAITEYKTLAPLGFNANLPIKHDEIETSRIPTSFLKYIVQKDLTLKQKGLLLSFLCESKYCK